MMTNITMVQLTSVLISWLTVIIVTELQFEAGRRESIDIIKYIYSAQNLTPLEKENKLRLIENMDYIDVELELYKLLEKGSRY